MWRWIRSERYSFIDLTAVALATQLLTEGRWGLVLLVFGIATIISGLTARKDQP